MAFPVDPLDDQFTTGGTPDAVDLDHATTDRLNALRAAVSLGLDASGWDATDVTLATIAQQYATSSQQTIVLPYDCTKLVLVNARFRMDPAGSNGLYTVEAAYNSGSSATPGAATVGGIASYALCSVPGANGIQNAFAMAAFSLAAGTYTFYGVLTRVANGTNSDFCAASQTAVLDVGGR